MTSADTSLNLSAFSLNPAFIYLAICRFGIAYNTGDARTEDGDCQKWAHLWQGQNSNCSSEGNTAYNLRFDGGTNQRSIVLLGPNVMKPQMPPF